MTQNAWEKIQALTAQLNRYRDEYYNEKALLLAREWMEGESKVLRWIGKDTAKELETMVKAEGRGRLISANTRMGKESGGSG